MRKQARPKGEGNHLEKQGYIVPKKQGYIPIKISTKIPEARARP